MPDLFLGVDIGGTKSTVAILNENLDILDIKTIPTLPEQGCRNLVERLYSTYSVMPKSQLAGESKIKALGIACPGPLDLYLGKIVYIPTMGFKNEPILEYFKQIFGVPCFLENDCNAAALGESVFGKGIGCNIVVYVTVSTGIGCGIVVCGNIIDGHNFAAGELGHFKVCRDGRSCACGGKGCLEAYASGTSISQITSEQIGQTLSSKQVFEIARGGNQTALDVITEAAEHLGFALASVYQILDPDIIILGGSVTNDYDVMRPYLNASIKKYIQNIDGRIPNIPISDFNGNQVVLGIAHYAKQQYGRFYE